MPNPLFNIGSAVNDGTGEVGPRAWLDKLNKGMAGPVLNVVGYGAKGDGLTDDTIALQTALTAAAITGGRVFLPAGKYIVTNSLVVSSMTIIEGVGADYFETGLGSIIQVKQNGIMPGVPVFNVSNTNWVTIRDLKLNVGGGNSAFNTTRGISDQNGACSFLLIDRCHFQWFGGDVIHLTGGVNWIFRNRANNSNANFITLTQAEGGSGSDNFIAFNESGGSQSNTGEALLVSGGSTNTILGNHLYNFGIGVHLTGVASYNRIEANRCEKHGSNGIQLDGGFANIVVGNGCFNNGYTVGNGTGIYLSNAQRCVIESNTCFNEPTYPGGTNQQFGIRLENSANFNDVAGNSCLKMQQYGVYVNLSSTNNSVRTNYIYQAQRQGIFVDITSSDNSIDGNTIYQCGQLTDNTYDAIIILGGSSNCAVRGNTIRHGGGAAQHRFGIRVNTSDCTGTIVADNDLRNAGKTGPYFDGGVGTLWSVPPGAVTLTDAATITTDASSGTVFTVTVAGNRSFGAPSNAVRGLRLTYIISQDASGNRFLAWNAVFKNTWSDLNNAANAVSRIEYVFDGTSWQVVSYIGYNGFVAVPKGFATQVLTKSGAFTASPFDAGVILCDATAAGFTLTLPFAGNNAGLLYRVKKIDSTANVVTIATGSGNIDGAATKSLTTQYASADIQCDGTNWFLL